MSRAARRARSLTVLLAVLAVLVGLALADQAGTQEPIRVPPIVDIQDPPTFAPELLPEWTAATAGGWALRLPLGGVFNIIDTQGGTCVPPSASFLQRHPDLVTSDGECRKDKLNYNVGAGDHEHRGYVVLSPDVGKGTILEDGHKHKLALIRSERYGGTEFRIRVRFEQGLTVCDRRGCVDVLRALRRAALVD